MGSWIALGLLIVAGLILVLNHESGTIAGFSNADFAGIVASTALLIYLGGSLFRGYRGQLSKGVKDAVTWMAIALLLVVGYSYRDEVWPVFQRIASELVPGMPVSGVNSETGAREVRIRRQADGQFVAEARINDMPAQMIVDTGASAIVLTASDARKIGVDVDALTFSVPVQTANGTTRAARIRLNRVSVGSLEIRKVAALIARPGDLHQSLLGMSFLSRLRSYEFSGDLLTLRG